MTKRTFTRKRAARQQLSTKHSNLLALSQILLGLATSPVQDRLTDEDRHRIANFIHDHIDNQRLQCFDLKAELAGMGL